MKIFIRLLTLFIITTLAGCNTDNVIPTTEVEIPLDPSKKYIHFDAEVSTRGALIEGNVLQDDFAVLGYQYSGTWESEQSMASPNVFDNTPQLVDYDQGLFKYTNPKAWTGNKYSFFGYYPSSHDAILFDNNTIMQGTPYIIYELPISSDPRDLIDVMTASYIDTGVASSASVAMQFRHRLSAIDVGARNYYEYDHDSDITTPNKKVTIEIVNLEVNLTNITSTSAKFYLDHNIETELNYVSPRVSVSYKMVDKDSQWALPSFEVIPNTASDRDIRLVTTSTGEYASTLLLLPQTELLHGALKLTYKKKYQNDNSEWIYLHEGDNVNDFEFNPDLPINFSKELIEGRRYYIELNFTSDAVSLNIVAADEWDTIDGDLTHEFE